jgi:ABC-type transporter MlaC component
MIARTLNRRTVIAATLAVLALPPPGLSSTAHAATADERLVHEAANQFLEIVRKGGRREDYAKALDTYFSISSMAMFALGKHRRKLKPKQMQQYLDLFDKMILNAVTKHGKKVRGKAFVVTRTRGGIVQGYVQHNLDRRTGVEFRTRKNRITDVRVQGIWLVITLRQSFDQLIQQGNGSIEAVFNYLRSGRTP